MTTLRSVKWQTTYDVSTGRARPGARTYVVIGLLSAAVLVAVVSILYGFAILVGTPADPNWVPTRPGGECVEIVGKFVRCPVS